MNNLRHSELLKENDEISSQIFEIEHSIINDPSKRIQAQLDDLATLNIRYATNYTEIRNNLFDEPKPKPFWKKLIRK